MATTPMGPLPSSTPPTNPVTTTESSSVSTRVVTLLAAHQWDLAAELLQEAELDPSYSSDSAFLLVFLQGLALLNSGQLLLAHAAFTRRGLPTPGASESSLAVLSSAMSSLADATAALLSGSTLTLPLSSRPPCPPASGRMSLLDRNAASVAASLASIPASHTDSAVGFPAERSVALAALAAAPAAARAAVVRELAGGAASLPLKGVAMALEWPRGKDLCAFLTSLHCTVSLPSGVVSFTPHTAAAAAASLPSSVLADVSALASAQAAEELLATAAELDAQAQ